MLHMPLAPVRECNASTQKWDVHRNKKEDKTHKRQNLTAPLCNERK